MAKLLITLTDSEKIALRNHARANRMSMAATIMLALDKHVPHFRQDPPASISISKDPQVDVGDLVFDED
jgi:hypothetical protein